LRHTAASLKMEGGEAATLKTKKVVNENAGGKRG
jgi:hypothetical protein